MNKNITGVSEGRGSRFATYSWAGCATQSRGLGFFLTPAAQRLARAQMRSVAGDFAWVLKSVAGGLANREAMGYVSR